MNENLIMISVSIVSLLFGIYSGLAAARRSARAEQRREASEMAMVIVKLEDISTGINEIKNDINNVKIDIRDLTARLIIAEQKLKQLDPTH